jgi:hypothetical protein
MTAAALKILPAGVDDNSSVDAKTEPRLEELEEAAQAQFAEVLAHVSRDEDAGSFEDVEGKLWSGLMTLGRLLLTLFLAVQERRMRRRQPDVLEMDGQRYGRRRAQARNLETRFGVVRYWRTYFRRLLEGTSDREGVYPLDRALGLTADRFSFGLLSLGVRLATLMSFAKAREVLLWFVPTAPSTEVLEQAVLGFGAHTQEYFEQAPPPEDDGEVLVIEIDGKGVPTATDQELRRRRGKRKPNPHPGSARHRGRRHRDPKQPRKQEQRPKRTRKKKSRSGGRPLGPKTDKSKNARMTTVVVMYTLRRAPNGDLLGPVNKRVYASFGPKRHAFEYARREALKRGFDPDGESGKRIQVVTDGDEHLAKYADEFFPKAIHTIDLMHVLERVWMAGKALLPKEGKALKRWVERQRRRLLNGEVGAVINLLERRLRELREGRCRKSRLKALEDQIRYLLERADRLDYAYVVEHDLVLGSGAVEGAVRHLVALRMDHGGMRWIPERAQALLQLRCIEINGDWASFTKWLHDRLKARGATQAPAIRIQQKTPDSLPEVGLAA